VELANRFAGQPLITTDAVLLEIGNALAAVLSRKPRLSLSNF
jgi:hypothetical protein